VGDPLINVETGELKRFAKDVGSGTDEVMRPAVGRATMPLRDGVTFGAKNASGAVHAAKIRYAQSLSASLSNLTEFIEAAKIMAEAAEMVARDFEAVDARSAEGSARVGGILRAATDEARAAQGPAQRPSGPAMPI
jgi:hypothetical protein